MGRWIRIADVSQCPPGTGLELVAEDRIVALFNVEGTFYAIDGVCPHQGGPLGKGNLTGCMVSCPWHGWHFDVRNGQHQLNPRLYQPCFNVRVDGVDVLVELTDGAETQ